MDSEAGAMRAGRQRRKEQGLWVSSCLTQRAVQLRAEAHGATTAVERECVEAVYAYEEVLSARSGKKQKASRTWPMIQKYGVLPAVERIVLKRQESVGFTALAELGLQEFAFEAVIIRHPDHFSPEALARSRERLESEGPTVT